MLDVAPVTALEEILLAQQAAIDVHASEPLRDYIVAVLTHTRNDPRVDLGASPRAGLMLLKAAKASAVLDGRDHALPDDVKQLAPSVLSHRLMLAPTAFGVERAEVVHDALTTVRAL